MQARPFKSDKETNCQHCKKKMTSLPFTKRDGTRLKWEGNPVKLVWEDNSTTPSIRGRVFVCKSCDGYAEWPRA